MKRIVALGAVSALLLPVVACTPAQPTTPTGDTTPIKIGYIGPLTGDAASYGKDTLNGVQIAVDEINAKGGVGGRKLEVIAEDGRCNGTDAASAAQKLVNVDHVVAIVGGQCSSETLAAAPIVEAGKVVLLSPVSSSPDITKAGEYVFRDYPSDALKAVATKQVFDEKGYKKVAILTENTDYAVGLQKALAAQVGSGNVVFNELIPAGSKDVRSVLTRLKGMEFDVMYVNGQSDAVIGAMVQQFREQGFTQPLFSQDVADSATLGSMAKDAVEGLQLINTSSKLGDTGSGSFADTFRKRYGQPQANMSFATLAHDAVVALSDALAEAGSGAALRDALADATVKGAAGTFSFDENGDVEGIGYALKQFQSGAIIEVDTIDVK